jgi:hypothetical protein
VTKTTTTSEDAVVPVTAIEPAIEVGDPGGTLAKTVAAAILADPARVRRLLPAIQAEALLLSAAPTLKDEE